MEQDKMRSIMESLEEITELPCRGRMEELMSGTFGPLHFPNPMRAIMDPKADDECGIYYTCFLIGAGWASYAYKAALRRLNPDRTKWTDAEERTYRILDDSETWSRGGEDGDILRGIIDRIQSEDFDRIELAFEQFEAGFRHAERRFRDHIREVVL